MNVNKKFDRLKQWSKERMGSEVRTDTNEEFKALEIEMQLRHEGMERLKKSSDAYIQHTGKRDRYQDKDQQLPIAYFGSTMVAHGDDFEADSEFGQCLSTFGRANERIARMQETYCANATSSWLESLERSLLQMKEYQKARKQLESRRLAYDTASLKMHKSKKEDFRMEEELRAQKMKYEESSEDVYRRMLDIKEAEVESVQDLTSFLEAELTYYDRCREVLLQLKREWPAQASLSSNSGNPSPIHGGPTRRNPRSRASSTTDRFHRIEEDEPLDPPRRIGSRAASTASSTRSDLPTLDIPHRPALTARSASTSAGLDPPSSRSRASSRDAPSPVGLPRLARMTTEPTALLGARSNLRVTHARESQSPSELSADEHSDSSDPYRTQNWSTAAHDGGSMVKKPPPPPPSRAKKPPPPPPPPMGRRGVVEARY